MFSLIAHNPLRWFPLLTIALLAVAPTVRAQSTWTGTTSNVWTDPTNWTGGVPVSGNTALFNATSANTSITLGGTAQPIGNITFDTAGAVAYILGNLGSGDAFTVDAGGTISVTNTVTTLQTINANLNSTGALNLSNSGTAAGGLNVGGNIAVGGALNLTNGVANTTMTLNGNITSAASVVYTATTAGASNNNNFIINGTNTYTGPTTITANTGSAGSIQIGTDSPFGTGKVTDIASGNAVQFQALNGPRTISNAIDLNNGLTLIGANNLTLAGPINVISSNPQRTYSNASTTAGVTLAFGSAASPSTLTLGNPVANGGDGVGKNALLNAVAGAVVTMNDLIQDPAAGGGTASGSVQIQGAGTVQFMNGNSTYSGTTTYNVNGGTVQIGASSNAAGTAGPFGTSTITPNSGTNSPFQAINADQTIANPFAFLFGITINNAATPFNLSMTGPITYPSVNTGGRTLTINSPGQTVTFGSATTPSTITLSSAANVPLLIDASAGTLLVINDVIQNNGAIAGLISYNSIGANTAEGTYLISGANTYTGGTGFGSQTTGPFGAATVLVNVSSVGSPGSITSGPFGTGTITPNDSNAPPILVPVGADRTVANAFTLTSGFWAGTATLAQDPTGPHNLFLTGPITNAGKVITNNMAAGVALYLGSPTTSSANTWTGTTTFQTQTGGTGGAGTTIIYDSIAGAGAIVVQNNATVVLNSANSYSGVTKVSGGTLLVNGANSGAGAVSAVGAGTGAAAVGTGGTLGGTGSLAGTITISAANGGTQGGILSPGPGGGLAGTLNAASMSWQPFGRYVFAYNGSNNATGGGVNNLISGSGTLDLSNLSGGSPFDLNLQPIAAGPTSQPYVIANFSGGITGAGSSFGRRFLPELTSAPCSPRAECHCRHR